VIDSEARERLADYMEDRRLELGLTWKEVAAAARLSYEVIRLIRTGPGGIRPLTARKLDTGLQWERKSVDRIIRDGRPPVPLPGSPGAPAPEMLRRGIAGSAGASDQVKVPDTGEG
jgi:hypothetical protein